MGIRREKWRYGARRGPGITMRADKGQSCAATNSLPGKRASDLEQARVRTQG